MQHRPKLFVFDEPTSGLDPLMQSEFFNLIREYVKEGATCMLSTHVLSEIKNYCKNTAIMKKGRLLCVDSVANITKYLSLNMKKAGAAARDIKELSLDEIFMHFYAETEVCDGYNL